MTLHLPLGWYLVPLLLTFASWSYAILAPIESHGGSYNFGGALTGMFRVIMAFIITLLAWLVYFAGRFVLG